VLVTVKSDWAKKPLTAKEENLLDITGIAGNNSKFVGRVFTGMPCCEEERVFFVRD
jgi:hypothetical protein